MNVKFIFILVLFSNMLFSQGEANNWYFGEFAGIKFNSNGTVTSLTDGQLNTLEGCASISNNTGELLFYTDGKKVYNRNHQIMINGSDLNGDSSTTQSATIVKKPGSLNLYYIFTLDSFAGPNGFCYSIVDMNLDNGNGAITSEKNVLIYTPSCEKIAVVKHSNNNDFWIITHGWGNNAFYAHLLTNNGLENNPVISTIGYTPNVNFGSSMLEAIGYLKISPDGTKLINCYSNAFGTQLFNFNSSTGHISNGRQINVGTAAYYGAEFSPNSELLYVVNEYSVYQLNLFSTDINNSATIIYTNLDNILPICMQLGPDNKIYVSLLNKNKLSVINNPNILGLGCTFQEDSIDLNGRYSKYGLPAFNQSYFYTPPDIMYFNKCLDESTTFSFNSNQTVLNASWNFGDGTTSNQISPTHTYTNPGNYTVTVTITTPAGTGSNTRNITIHPRPILLQNTLTLKQCDDNNDGFSSFNLRQTETMFVSSTTDLTFTYYTNLTDAQNNTANAIIANPIAYTNPLVNADVVYVRIENGFGCYSIGQINLIVSTTVIPPSFQKTFTVCDDALSGSATDGIATFDLSSVTTDVQSLFPTGQLLTITYYDNLADALAEQNAITNLATYTNWKKRSN